MYRTQGQACYRYHVRRFVSVNVQYKLHLRNCSDIAGDRNFLRLVEVNLKIKTAQLAPQLAPQLTPQLAPQLNAQRAAQSAALNSAANIKAKLVAQLVAQLAASLLVAGLDKSRLALIDRGNLLE